MGSTNNDKSVLRFNSVNLKKKTLTLLENVSFSIAPYEICCLIGPNGAGKTSLLKTVAGDDTEYEGTIQFNGQTLHKRASQKNTYAQQIAVLPQLSSLNFPYTVRDVILLGRTPHTAGIKTDNRIVDELITLLELDAVQDNIYTQLSGGEKQRTQLARVLAQVWQSEQQEPRLLLLDEPTNALDLRHQQILLRFLKKLAEDGVSILMVLHDLEMAANIANRIIGLDKGRIVLDGPPNEVITKANIKKLYAAEVEVLHHPESQRIAIIK